MRELEISRNKIRLTGLDPRHVTIALAMIFAAFVWHWRCCTSIFQCPLLLTELSRRKTTSLKGRMLLFRQGCPTH